MELVAVPPSSIDLMWAKLEPRIANVVALFKDDGYTTTDVLHMVKTYDAQMWTTSEEDAIFVTQIMLNNMKQPYLLIWMFEADKLLDEHWELLDQIKAWGKSHGCKTAKVVCRPGFEKQIMNHGWKKRHITLTQEI
jgi:hypothetical protein